MKPAVFPPLARELGALLARKNGAYGQSFRAGAFLRLLFPAGIRPEQYDDAFLLARIFDKCRRVATRKGAFGESPYLDIAGYGLLGVAKDRTMRRRKVGLKP